jgi:hypothetical protein
LVDTRSDMPCPMPGCLSPCHTYDPETNREAPLCADGQECITEMTYMELDGKQCPMCERFVDCKQVD